MLGGMRFKRGKKPVTKPKLNQPPKTPKKQDVRPVAKKQAIIKPTKEIKQSPNPYERFLKNNKPASIEDLTKYFELRTSRFSTRFTAGVAVALSLFALLLTTYYQAIQQSISIDRLVLGNIVSGVFVGAAITLMVFLWKNLAAMSDSNFDKHFGWYLEAKSHFKTSQQSPILEAVEINPNPPQVEETEAAEETDITDESNNLEDSEELRKFLSKLESAAGSA
jgi:hypothetical protein